jgi:hypothetical protein
MLRDPRQHFGSDFHRIVKRPDVVTSFRMHQNHMRSPLRLNLVSNAEKRAEYFRRLRAGPLRQG